MIIMPLSIKSISRNIKIPVHFQSAAAALITWEIFAATKLPPFFNYRNCSTKISLEIKASFTTSGIPLLR
jgi:hypothetical protein